jgi:hypothetical protein
MKTFRADIIPRIQRYSQKLDDLTKLTNQHWISLDEIGQTKLVYIFRENNQLLISDNGIIKKGTWEYLGNQSLLIETNQGCFLLKNCFFDQNIIAFKFDSANKYTFFINETKFENELNSIEDIVQFLTMKYLIKNHNDSDGEFNGSTIPNEQKKWLENPDAWLSFGFSDVIDNN